MNTKAGRQQKRDSQLNANIARSFVAVERIERLGNIIAFGQMNNGRYGVMTSTDNSSKVTWYGFFNLEEMEAYIIRMFNNILDAVDYKLSRAEAKSVGHTLKAGDTLYTSWGYDQTNVDFFVVTRVLSKHYVEVVKIGRDIETTSPAQGIARPDHTCTSGKPVRKKATENMVINIDGIDNYGRFYGNRDGVGCSWDR